MSAGTLTMACVLLVAGQSPADGPTYSKHRGMLVPLDVKLAQQPQFREVVLYYSNDQGKSWYRYGDPLPPSAEGFKFFAPADGEYWFRCAAIDTQGKQHPENLYQGPPQQKVIIDTVAPQLRISSARREGDDLVVSWEASETNPDPASLKLEYQVQDGTSSVWLPLDARPGPTGQGRAKLTGPAPVLVRLQMRDLAQNVSEARAEVAGAGGVQAVRASDASPAGTGQGPLPLPPGQTGESQERKANFIPPPPAQPKVADPQGQLPLPGALPLPAPPEGGKTGAGQPTPRPQGGTGQVPVASSDKQQPAAAPTAPQPAPRRPQPEVQRVNSREIVLEYQLSKVGPSGIGSIMLYLTQDGGKNWVQFVEDPEAEKATTGTKYQRTLELPGEGVFGLYLVVRNPAGVGKSAPKPGDAPEMVIEVDTTAPSATLFKPGPDPVRRDALLLTWTAEDRNLTPRPITLEWAAESEGPWHEIATDLANTSKYSWVVPQGTPVRVFLRLRVRDTAGNVGLAVTPQPQLVDLSEPEGALVGVRPAIKRAGQ